MPLTNPQLTILQPHNQATVNLNQPFPVTGQVVNPFIAGEPVLIDSVTVRVDGGPVIEATLTPVTDKSQTKVNFAASAQVTAGEDPHALTVTATNDQGISATKTVSVLTEPVVVVPPAYTVEHIYVDRLTGAQSLSRMRRNWRNTPFPAVFRSGIRALYTLSSMLSTSSI